MQGGAGVLTVVSKLFADIALWGDISNAGLYNSKGIYVVFV